jgi:hypothetical protein
VAFNYDMWNVPSTQVAVFVTLAVLVRHALDRSPGASRGLPLAAAAVIVVVQAVFLIGGHRFVREWDVTEYKELLIPLGFLAHALTLAPVETGQRSGAGR